VLRPSQLITLDWIAGATAGVLMLALRGWLAELYRLPASLLFIIAVANLGYASFSFVLFLRRRGEYVPLLRVVAVANILWGVVCVILAVVWFGVASLFGLASLLGEAVLVGGLGLLEWRARRVVAPALVKRWPVLGN
jgi:hypothetical protein